MPWEQSDPPAGSEPGQLSAPVFANHAVGRYGALIVDGDVAASCVLADYLKGNGLDVETASDGRGMDQALTAVQFDVIILAVALPGEDGLSICRRLSSSPIPIILRSETCEEVDRIVGLELGAADCLPKSCNPRELLARVRAVLRGRERSRAAWMRSGPTYRFGAFALDTVHDRLFFPSGEVTILTRSEHQLLVALLDHPQQILRRGVLPKFGRTKQADRPERATDAQISRLRRKLGGTEREAVIRTVRGIGYALSVPVTRA